VAVLTACQRRTKRGPLQGEALRAALTRRWLVCSDHGLFLQPQAGFELRADGRWSLLGWTATGQLEVLTGVDNEGQFALTNEGVYAAFSWDLGRTIYSLPQLSRNPAGLWLNNTGTIEYEYVDAAEVALGPDTVPPPPPAPGGDPRCQKSPGSAATPAALPDLRQALSRRWLRCSPLSLFGVTDDAGIEITSDDKWYFLRRNGQGQLERSGDAYQIQYDSPSMFSGQVNFARPTGVIVSHPVVTAAPTWLIINNIGFQEYRYVPLD
jgi:hypothetical protein